MFAALKELFSRVMAELAHIIAKKQIFRDQNPHSQVSRLQLKAGFSLFEPKSSLRALLVLIGSNELSVALTDSILQTWHPLTE